MNHSAGPASLGGEPHAGASVLGARRAQYMIVECGGVEGNAVTVGPDRTPRIDESGCRNRPALHDQQAIR